MRALAMMAGMMMAATPAVTPALGQQPVQWRVGDAVDVPLTLGGMTRQTVAWTDHGKARTCEGVWMTDLLARAGAPVGDAVRGPALSMVVMAEAADGYRAVFSLGETDAKLGAARLLVADACDGKRLEEADGPLRIVAPGAARGARSVRQLVRLTLLPIEK